MSATFTFGDSDVPMALLRQRAHNLRWATLPEDVIPLTAADPDFAVAPVVREAIVAYAQGGVFSYGPAEGLAEFRQVCARVVRERKGAPADPALVLAVDSAAAGMRHIAKLVLRPGDEAIVFDPVDFLFKASVEAAGGTVRLLPIDPASGRLDLDALPGLLTPRTRLLTVCNPVNPIGATLTPHELRVLGEFAVANDLWILNDEIWSDIVYSDATFTSLPGISPAIAARTFSVHGFSKSFGLAGLRVGFIVAPDEERFAALLADTLAPQTMSGVATLSQIAAIAAYEQGWPWQQAFLAHLQRMRDRTVAALRSVEGVQVRTPEGCFVTFPDVSALTDDAEDLTRRMLHEARVAVVPGAARWFGPGATGHLRICFSTSEAILDEGLGRLTDYLAGESRRRKTRAHD